MKPDEAKLRRMVEEGASPEAVARIAVEGQTLFLPVVMLFRQLYPQLGLYGARDLVASAWQEVVGTPILVDQDDDEGGKLSSRLTWNDIWKPK